MRACVALTIAATVLPVALAGPVVKLTDGRELAGTDLRREGDVYLLVIQNGATIPIPTAVVREVSWVETEPSPGSVPPRAGSRAAAGDRESPGEVSAGVRDGGGVGAGGFEATERPSGEDSEPPHRGRAQTGGGSAGAAGGGTEGEPEGRGRGQPGVRVTKPRNLAGGNVPPPAQTEQLAVFGRPAEFAQDVVHFDNQPSYWVMDPDEAIGNPSTWQKPLRDPNWRPTPAFDPSEDVLADGRTKWRESPHDSSWRPTDGFSKAGPSDD